MERSEICRYCGGVIRLVPARAVYGSAVKRLGLEKEYIYQCQNCNARVGCHKGHDAASGPCGQRDAAAQAHGDPPGL